MLFGLVVIAFMPGNDLTGSTDGFTGGEPTEFAFNTIPPELYDIYRKAQERYGVAWNVLAAINSIETDFGRNVKVSSKGAIGWMHFMPTTWSGWQNPNSKDDLNNPVFDKDPARIAQYGGYGVDADGDGVADPFSKSDAIFSAAYLLQKNEFQKNPEQAIYQYNHDYSYVKNVLNKAIAFASMIPIQGHTIWPVPDKFKEIISGFGPRLDPFGSGIMEMHRGIDIPVLIGTPVFTVADGEVIFAGIETGYGTCVQIKHEGYITLYAHLSEYLVRKGDRVTAGIPIALSGNTGKSEGPHLHFGVIVNNQFVDPLLIFNKS
ncbi:MAG: hypothetical protein VR68_08645 [Peptococcaceae bacterium BRH_c4a]|nr:MAG: hypothetical protein VR68_08645 [Peptococcaceae bacterium BRH_c4a]